VIAAPRPVGITLHRSSHILEVEFDTGETFRLPCEYLRVNSPSAEVPSQRILQHGKQNVNVAEIRPVGNYGVILQFDDGHNTGIYSWSVLYDLGKNQTTNWAEYLDALRNSGLSR
jgi:DUF971 family protein